MLPAKIVKREVKRSARLQVVLDRSPERPLGKPPPRGYAAPQSTVGASWATSTMRQLSIAGPRNPEGEAFPAAFQAIGLGPPEGERCASLRVLQFLPEAFRLKGATLAIPD